MAAYLGYNTAEEVFPLHIGRDARCSGRDAHFTARPRSPRCECALAECRTQRRVLRKRGAAQSAAEVVAYVGVAVAGIIAQAPVEWKRLVGLDDAVARAVDGGRVVRGDSQGRAQRGRSRKA